MKFIDTKLNLNDISWKLLRYLKKIDLKFVQKSDDVDFKTSAWYNGRERGFCLEVSKFSDRDRVLYICWAEHRISDDIRIFNTTCKRVNSINPLTISDFSDFMDKSFWGSDNTFRSSDLDGASEFIIDLIRDWHKLVIVGQIMSA